MHKSWGSRRRVIDICDPSYERRNLPEQIHPFTDNREFVSLKAGYIASWSRKTLDKTAAYRIADIREHNRNGARLLYKRGHNGRGTSADDLALNPNKLFLSDLHPLYTPTPQPVL